MERYCRSHPETKLSLQGWSKKDHGVRIDTQEYAYLMRLIPVKGDYNLYCYCHKRDMLDKHLGIPEKHEDEKVLDATGISNEMFLNEVCREYEAKLRELMGKKAFDEYVPEVSKKAFRFRLKGRDGKAIGYNFAEDDFCSYGERSEDVCKGHKCP
jgi:hypothetical protein